LIEDSRGAAKDSFAADAAPLSTMDHNHGFQPWLHSRAADAAVFLFDL